MTTEMGIGHHHALARHQLPRGGRHELRRALWPRSRFGVIVGAAALALFSGAAGAVGVVELRPAPASGQAAPSALPQPPTSPAAATVEQAAANAIPSVVKLETATDTLTVE